MTAKFWAHLKRIDDVTGECDDTRRRFYKRKFKEYIDVKMEERDSGFSVEGFLKIFEVN